MKILHKTYGTVCCFFALLVTSSSLYPNESPTREVKKLDGVWNFRICSQTDQDEGFRNKWYLKSLFQQGDVIPMPVPSSFNDITQNKTIRDYLGWSWYETEFYVPKRWESNFRVILRFGSAHYIARVFLNGHSVVNHTGGHLPFQTDVTHQLLYSSKNRLTGALNNTLSDTTIPQGSKTFKSPSEGPYPPGFYTQGTNFDFYNYAGIHRSVVLYAVPQLHITDIHISTDVQNGLGYVNYSITTNMKKRKNSENPRNQTGECEVTVLTKDEQKVAFSNKCEGVLALTNPTLWWPYTMHPNPGYQYVLKVQANFNKGPGKQIKDIYFQKFGIRSVHVDKNHFYVNGKPFYFTGFGKHEDSNIRGKGLDLPLIIKDFNLIKWIGANSFRTSHYPYAEELMDQADDQGVVVIDESPAVGLTSFSKDMKDLHRQFLTELIARDKNRPSVFAWSVANEPKSTKPGADDYFKDIINHVKRLDPTRPVTAAINADYKTDKAGKHLDFVMMNHYFSWYSDPGSTEVIYPLLTNYVAEAHTIYKKPIMMSEYGADTVAGLHRDPSFIFTEDYQVELMIEHHKAFDTLRTKGFFIGEHIWNFADFLTIQQITRVVGNKKGIFTRERQPKASAKLLRCRYHKLANMTAEDNLPFCHAYTTCHLF